MNVPGSHEAHRIIDPPGPSHPGSASGLRTGAAMSASGVIAYEGEVGEELGLAFEEDAPWETPSDDVSACRPS